MSHSSSARRKRPGADFRDFKEPRTGGGGAGGLSSPQTDKASSRDRQKIGRGGASEPVAREPAIKVPDDPMYERNMYVTLNMVGHIVEVQVKDGSIFEGVFHTANMDKNGYGVVLKLARKKDPSAASLPTPVETLIIPASDFVQVIGKELNFYDEVIESQSPEFKTDKDISGRDFRERELVAWTPDEEIPTNLSLDNTFSKKGDWDQFEVNEKLFGVRTSFNEEFYTTPLDRASTFYREHAKEAQRLANEINAKAANNPHLAEERGQKDQRDNDNDEDEEDKYGAVIRSTPIPPSARLASVTAAGSAAPAQVVPAEGKYIPPAKRGPSFSDVAKGKTPAPASTTPTSTTSTPAPAKTAAPAAASASASSPSPTTAPASTKKEETDSQKPSTPSPTTERFAAVTKSPSGEDVKPKWPNSPKLTRLRESASPESSPRTLRLENPLVVHRAQLQVEVASKQAAAPSSVPASINALNLDPAAPKLPEEVVREFSNFKTKEAERKSQSKQDELAALKNFSAELEKKRVAPSASPSDSAPRLSSSGSSINTSAVSTSATTDEKSSESATATNGTQPTSTTSSDSTSTPSTTTSSTTTTSGTTTPAKPVSKLNPNAKVFKPSSALARPFVPASMQAPQVPMVPMQNVVPMGPGVVPVQAMVAPTKPLDFNRSLNSVYTESKRRQPTEVAEQVAPAWPYGRTSYKHIGDEEVYQAQMRMQYAASMPYQPGMPPQVIGYAPVRAAYVPQAPIPGGVASTGVYYPAGAQQYAVPARQGIPAYAPAQQPLMGAPKQPGYYPIPMTPSGPAPAASKGMPALPLSSPAVYAPAGGPPGSSGAAAPAGTAGHNPTQPLGTTPYPYAPPAYGVQVRGYPGYPADVIPVPHHLVPTSPEAGPKNGVGKMQQPQRYYETEYQGYEYYPPQL